MSMFQSGADSLAELHRELNALCGLVQFARERCYPATLTTHLEQLLAETAAEASRRRAGFDAAA